MSVSSYKELKKHVGHTIVCVKYKSENVAIECEDCCEVLMDFDRVHEKEEKVPKSEFEKWFVKHYTPSNIRGYWKDKYGKVLSSIAVQRLYRAFMAGKRVKKC